MTRRAALLLPVSLLAACAGLLETGATRVPIPVTAPDGCVTQAFDALFGAGSTRTGSAGWTLAAFPWEGHARLEAAAEARVVHLEISRVRRYTPEGPAVAVRLQQARDLLTTTCQAPPAPNGSP